MQDCYYFFKAIIKDTQMSHGQTFPAQKSPAQTFPAQTSPGQTSPGQTFPGQILQTQKFSDRNLSDTYWFWTCEIRHKCLWQKFSDTSGFDSTVV